MEGLKGSKIIITGASGFIGSHLCDALVKLGANVVAIDIEINPRSYFILNSVYTNVDFRILDIRNRQLVATLIRDEKPDHIIHLAAQTLVTTAYDNPYETLETNIMGTVNVLEAARMMDSIKSIIVASSDKAYGKSNKTYSLNQPLQGDHPYDVSKSSADLICQTYHKTYGLPTIVTRFGNVYGEGDTHIDRIVPGICEAVIKKKELVIRSNGKYVRDYLYIEDVVKGYTTLIKNHKKIEGEAFNFSSPDTLSVMELHNKVQLLLKKKIPYVILNNAHNEIPYQHLDDVKIKKLGWKNNYLFEDTFPSILEWYRQIL